jgi:hypothetical protein
MLLEPRSVVIDRFVLLIRVTVGVEALHLLSSAVIAISIEVNGDEANANC